MSMLTTSHSSSVLISSSFQEGMAARRSTASGGELVLEQGSESRGVSERPRGYIYPSSDRAGRLTAVNGRAVSARGQVA